MRLRHHFPLGAVLGRLALAAACLLWLAVLAMLALYLPLLAVLLFAGLAWRRLRRWRGSGYAHGTARLADLLDLCDAQLVGRRDGLLLARAGSVAPPPLRPALTYLFAAPLAESRAACLLFLASLTRGRLGREELLRAPPRTVHLATVAGTGAGKGVAVVVPNLLTYCGAVVTTDVKDGENYKLTAAQRRRAFGQEVFRLDPFDRVRQEPRFRHAPAPDSFNPLDIIHPDDPSALDHCRTLANAIVIRTGHEHDPHFNEAAEIWIWAFIAAVGVHSSPDKRNLQEVRELLTNPDARTGAIEIMRRSDAYGGMLARLGHQLSSFVDRELGSVLTTVHRHLAFLDSPTVAASTTHTSFDLNALRSQAFSLYLVLPADKLRSHAALPRLWLVSFLQFLIRSGASEQNPVLFVLDEIAHLGGHIQALEDALTLYRSYGVRLWWILQGLAQLQELFPHGGAGKFQGNIDVLQVFGLRFDLQSAEMVSALLGDATIAVESTQAGWSHSRSAGSSFANPPQDNSQWSSSTSSTWSEAGRRLLKPEEILQLPEHQCLIFARGTPPVLGTLLRWYDAPEFRHLGRLRLRVRRLLTPVAVAILALAIGLVAARAIPELAHAWHQQTSPPSVYEPPWLYRPHWRYGPPPSPWFPY